MTFIPFLFLECDSLVIGYWLTVIVQSLAKVIKGAWRMPWLTEAMKDVISCDKPGVGANDP